MNNPTFPFFSPHLTLSPIIVTEGINHKNRNIHEEWFQKLAIGFIALGYFILYECTFTFYTYKNVKLYKKSWQGNTVDHKIPTEI